MARKKTSEGDQIALLKAKVQTQADALTAARTGLFQIANINPTTFTVTPGKSLKIVKAFEKAKATAEKTLIKVSDLEGAVE